MKSRLFAVLTLVLFLNAAPGGTAVVVSNADGTLTATEDFESFDPLDNGIGDVVVAHDTVGTASVSTLTDPSDPNNTMLRLESDGQTTTRSGFSLPGNICGHSARFTLNIPSTPPSGESYFIGFSDPGHPNFNGYHDIVGVNVGYSASGVLISPSGFGTAGGSYVVAAGSDMDLKFEVDSCAAGTGAKATIKDFTNTKVVTLTGQSDHTISGSGLTRFYTYQGSNNPLPTYSFYVDDFELTYPEPPFNPGASASATLTNLQAWALDAEGSTIIVKENCDGTGCDLKTYIGGALGTPIGTSTTDCNHSWGGISVGPLRNGGNVYVLTCDDLDPNHVDQVRIRSPTFGDPLGVPAGCNQECPKDLNQDEGFPNFLDVPADMEGLEDLTGWVFVDPAIGFNHAKMVFAWSSLDGELGAWKVGYQNNAGDGSATVRKNVNPGTPWDQTCTWRNPDNGQDYIIGVSEAGISGMYRIQPNFTGGATTVEPPIVTTIVANLAPAVQSDSVGCGRDFVVVKTASGTVKTIRVLGSGAGQTLSSVETGETVDRAVSMSRSGEFVAYKVGGAVRVANATDLSDVRAEVTVPSGTWRGVHLDPSGSSLWVFTSTQIARYDVSTVTCGTSCVFTEDGEFLEPDNPSTGGGGGQGAVGGGGALDPTGAGEAIGVSDTAMAWFFGVLFTIMVTAGLATVSLKLAPAGIPLGVAGAVGFGYIQFWFVLFILLIAAAVVVLRFKSGTGAE